MNMRLVYLTVGLVLGAGACWLGQRALIAGRESGCNVESHTKTAPGGDFRATLTYKTCGWGFGLAANFSSVKLEKLGANGWSQNIDLETDEPPAESPTMEWTDSSHLEMVIKSDHISGLIQIAEHGLHFTRRYVSAK